MADVDYYLTTDHAARKRSMLVSVIAGVICGGLAALSGQPDRVVAFLCGAVTIGTEFFRALTYRRTYKYIESPFLVRRYLLRLAASLPAFVIVPAMEARVMDHTLHSALKEGPPYTGVGHLMIFAIQNGAIVRTTTLDIARQAIVQAYLALPIAEQWETGVTLAQIQAYEVYSQTDVKLNVRPMGIGLIDIQRPEIFRITRSILMHYVSVIGYDKNRDSVLPDFDYAPENPAVFVYERARESFDAVIGHVSAKRPSERSLAKAPAFVVIVADGKLAVIDVIVSNLSQVLDSIIWVNVTFERCFISYHGGPLFLKSVVFKQCEFENGAVLDKIRRNGGNPVTVNIS